MQIRFNESTEKTPKSKDRSVSPVPDYGRSTRGRSRSRSRGRSANSDGPQHGNTTNDESEGDEIGGGAEATGSVAQNKRQLRENNRKAHQSKTREVFLALPEENQEFVWNILVGRVGETIEQHPLSSSVSTAMKQDAVLEIALQVRELLSSTLILPKRPKNATDNSLVSNDVLFATVTRALSSTAGAKSDLSSCILLFII
jgi:hypothetical protein